MGPLLVLMVVGLLGYGLLKEDPDASHPLQGSAAPAFELQTLDGSLFQFDGQDARPMLVTFGASWCLPCRQEAPLLRQASEKHGAKVRFLGIISDPRDRGARQFVRDFQLRFPYAMDRQMKVSIDYGVAQYPVTVLVKGGKVLYRKMGAFRPGELEKVLEGI